MKYMISLSAKMIGAEWILTILCAVVSAGDCRFETENEEYLTFPSKFLLGAASAAYQVEGAWNTSDKAESVWDRFVHEGNGRIYQNHTGDIACDSYHKYREDVAILKNIGLNAYRFSVSWPRILPTGFANKISNDGLAYYKNLVKELVDNGIEPIVTLYHWDQPQVIEDAGGWTNEKIVDWFGDYARIVFRELGDKVKKFVTINEPAAYCVNSYSTGKHAPGKSALHGIGEYLCGENILRAHARAYRIYEREFKPSQRGLVGLIADVQDYIPKDANDTRSTEIVFQFAVGWMLHPIYLGDYPQIMKEMVAKKSRVQGYPHSRLPELSLEKINDIRGTADFLGINHYTTKQVEPGFTGDEPSHLNDQGILKGPHPTGKPSASAWLKVVPEGFGNVLRKLSSEYNHPEIYVLENGVSDVDGVDDIERISYFHDYLKEMLLAINRDGVNVRGYMLWSFLDNFEWEQGYSERFGIIHVNFTDPSRRRTLKASAHWWKQLIQNWKLEPVTVTSIISKHLFSDNT